ncbi:MAG: DUF4401 domain-containing protein, partial [Bacteroidota bacterium]
KFGKIALAAAGVVFPVILALVLRRSTLARDALLTTAAFMVGGLFAVLGQIYQTGANAYDLFLAWVLFTAIWTIVVDFPALWLLWLALVNATLVLYGQQVISGWEEWLMPFILMLMNGIALVGFIVVGSRSSKQSYPKWMLIILALAASFMGVQAAFLSLFAGYVLGPTPAFMVILIFLLASWLAYRRQELVYLAILALALVVIGVGLIIYVSEDIGGFFLASFWTLGATTAFSFQLNRLRKAWLPSKEEATQDQAIYTENEVEKAIVKELAVPESQQEELLEDFRTERREEHSFAMRALNLFGGLLAVIALIGFFFVAGLIESTASFFVLGTLLYAGAAILDRSATAMFIQSVVVALVTVGSIFLLIGFSENAAQDETVTVLGFLLSLGTLALFRNPIVTFLSTFGACISVLILLTLYQEMFLVHLYVGLVGVACFLLVYWEDWIASQGGWITRKYSAVRLGLIGGLVLGSLYVGNRYWWVEEPSLFNGYAALMIIPLLLVFCWRELRRTDRNHQPKPAYLIGVAILLLPTLLAPAAAPTLLILLLSFGTGYRLGTAIGALALVYFLGQYYYDLNLTLLTKAYVLLVSGALLLAAYKWLQPKLSTDETIR